MPLGLWQTIVWRNDSVVVMTTDDFFVWPPLAQAEGEINKPKE